MIAIIIIAAWVISILIAFSIHMLSDTRAPKNMIDLAKLTFLPYVVYSKIFNPNNLL